MDSLIKNIEPYLKKITLSLLPKYSNYTYLDIYNRCLIEFWKSKNKTISPYLFKSIINGVKSSIRNEKNTRFCLLKDIPLECEKISVYDLMSDAKLTELETAILTLSFELNTPEYMLGKFVNILDITGKHTAQDISHILGMDLSHINYVKRKAINKLKKCL